MSAVTAQPWTELENELVDLVEATDWREWPEQEAAWELSILAGIDPDTGLMLADTDSRTLPDLPDSLSDVVESEYDSDFSVRAYEDALEHLRLSEGMDGMPDVSAGGESSARRAAARRSQGANSGGSQASVRGLRGGQSTAGDHGAGSRERHQAQKRGQRDGSHDETVPRVTGQVRDALPNVSRSAALLGGLSLDTDSRTLPDLPNAPNKTNWVEKAGGLPSYIKRIAKHLHFEKGFDVSRAIAIAVNTVKRWCTAGTMGEHSKNMLHQVGAKAKALACKAVAAWEAKRGGSKVNASQEDKEKLYAYEGVLLSRADIEQIEAMVNGSDRTSVELSEPVDMAEYERAVEQARKDAGLDLALFEEEKHPRGFHGRWASTGERYKHEERQITELHGHLKDLSVGHSVELPHGQRVTREKQGYRVEHSHMAGRALGSDFYHSPSIWPDAKRAANDAVVTHGLNEDARLQREESQTRDLNPDQFAKRVEGYKQAIEDANAHRGAGTLANEASFQEGNAYELHPVTAEVRPVLRVDEKGKPNPWREPGPQHSSVIHRARQEAKQRLQRMGRPITANHLG